ncbi:VWA domain-containing protein, partial [bacterium]
LGHPVGAWLLLAAVPIVALYMLRHRRPPRKVASLLLFRPTERDRQAQKTWRRLLPELSLLLQLLALALATVAAVRPSWTSRSDAEGALAIVLDASASMATRESEDRTRLDLAKAEARALLREHAGGHASLIVAASAPRLAAGHDAGGLEAELEAVVAEDSGADLERAVALAEEKLRGQAGARIVVLTDPSAPFHTARPAVRVRRFGVAHPNVAVLAAHASRIQGGVEIAAVVVSFGEAPRDVRVVLRALATSSGERIAADPTDTRELHLVPRARTPVRFVVPEREAQAAYEIALSDADSATEALDRDDRAVTIVPASAKLPVVVVGAAYAPLVRALAADPRLALQLESLEEHARIDVPADALEIFLDVCPTLRR